MKIVLVLIVGISLGAIISMAARQISVEGLRTRAIQALGGTTPTPPPTPATIAVAPPATPAATPNWRMLHDKQNPLNKGIYNRIDYSGNYK